MQVWTALKRVFFRGWLLALWNLTLLFVCILPVAICAANTWPGRGVRCVCPPTRALVIFLRFSEPGLASIEWQLFLKRSLLGGQAASLMGGGVS